MSMSGMSSVGGAGSGGKIIPPVKIVAGNKCDLQESRQVPAALGLDWARRRGCGFMETSARLEVNIEETFALIVRRVVEARRMAEMGIMEAEAGMNSRGMTKPLSPLPSGGGGGGMRPGGRDAEKGGGGGRAGHHQMDGHHDGGGGKGGRSGSAGSFWRSLMCW